MSLLFQITQSLKKEYAQHQALILNPFHMKSFEDYRYHLGLTRGLSIALEVIHTTLNQTTEEDDA